MFASSKTLIDLEWGIFLQHLASRCASSESEKRCLNLPFLSESDAWNHMELIDEFVTCINNDDTPPLLDAAFIAVDLVRIESDGEIEKEVYTAIAYNIRLFIALVSYLDNRKDICIKNRELLRSKSGDISIISLSRLAARIESTFTSDGAIADSASPKLAGLKKRVKSLRESILSQIEDIAKDNADILGDNNVTLRNDRYVLPVRTDKHRTLRGIVHGSSATGGTFFVEPQGLVESGNDLVLAKEAVIREEQRILARLRKMIKDDLPAVRYAGDSIIDFDTKIAAAKLSWDIDAAIPQKGSAGTLNLKGARHPLLILEGIKVVPNNIDIAPGKTLLISGPNAGGKTVVLKTAGILSLMLKAGLPVSAYSESVAGIPGNILSDIGDDQSLAESLSTFSAHMKNISSIFEQAKDGSIVLLDELSSGTDPFEGAALARAILDGFNRVDAATISTTHFRSVKEYAVEHEQFEIAAMGYDAALQKPTYQLLSGVSGHSSAISTARQYGIPAAVLDCAVTLLPEDVQKLNSAIEKAEKEQKDLEIEKNRLKEAVSKAQKDRDKYSALLKEIKKREDKFINRESEALWESIRSARSVVRDAERSIRRKKADINAVKDARVKINKAADSVDIKKITGVDTVTGRVPSLEDIRPGAAVYIISTKHKGVADSFLKGNTFYVKVNNIRMRVSLDDVRIIDNKGGNSAKSVKQNSLNSSKQRIYKTPRGAELQDAIRTSQNTLNLRGVRVDEGIDMLDCFLDDALKTGSDIVYVLTGYGTGALMSGIRRHLKESRYVEKFRPGTKEEGGDAVTAIWLR